MRRSTGLLLLAALLATSTLQLSMATRHRRLAAVTAPAVVAAPTLTAAQKNGLPVVQTNAPPATQPNEVVIDVDEPLPTEIHLPEGALITLVRKDPRVGSNVEDSQTVLDGVKDPVISRIFYIRAPDAPAGYRIVGQYSVGRKGTGGLVITHTVAMPSAIPQSVTIRIVVK